VAYLSRVKGSRILVTGPVEAEMPPEIPIDVPMLGDEEATAKCTRYFNLLEQMVRDFLGAHQHS
jgi:hypothetical protein